MTAVAKFGGTVGSCRAGGVPTLQARGFERMERVLLLFRKNVGEEICLLARKDGP